MCCGLQICKGELWASDGVAGIMGKVETTYKLRYVALQTQHEVNLIFFLATEKLLIWIYFSKISYVFSEYTELTRFIVQKAVIYVNRKRQTELIECGSKTHLFEIKCWDKRNDALRGNKGSFYYAAPIKFTLVSCSISHNYCVQYGFSFFLIEYSLLWNIEMNFECDEHPYRIAFDETIR